MLYVPTKVNGHPVKAFVDSGAQATIMSPTCAEECGILHLLDKRFAGIARGAGTAKIYGRVHSADIKIGKLFLPCSFTVMEGREVHLLLGLDMLKRYQVSIDMKKNALIILDEEIPFLGEADLPKTEIDQEPVVNGPSGMVVGGRTGAIMPAGQAHPSDHNTSNHPPAQQPSSVSSGFPRSAISQLTSLGFAEDKVMEALRQANGNVELAAGLLYQ